MFWKLVCLISMVLFWVCLVILLVRWPRFRNKSISQHAASFKDAYIFFTIAQVVIGFVLYLFIIKWFIPTFKLSFVFTVIYTITAWLQISTALLPDTATGLRSMIHQNLANTFAVGMLVSSVILSTSPGIHGFPRALFMLTAIFMASNVIYALAKKAKIDTIANYLRLQVIYIVAFQVSILVATFSK